VSLKLDLVEVTKSDVALVDGEWALRTEGIATHAYFTARFDPPDHVGLVLLGNEWVKGAAADLRVSILSWTAATRGATFLAAISGSQRSTNVTNIDEPPPSIAATSLTTGVPQVLLTLGDVTLTLLLFARADVRMGRNHLWSLRADLAAKLRDDTLRSMLTQGRTGHLLPHQG